MSDYELIVSSIFRLITFIIIIYICIHLFKKYALNALEQEFLSQEGILQGLEEKEGMLRARMEQLDQEKEAEEARCQKLYARVVRWRMSTDRRQAYEQEQLKDRWRNIESRLREQAQHITQEQLQKQVVPAALEKARHDLLTMYADPDHGHAFLEQVVARVLRHRGTHDRRLS